MTPPETPDVTEARAERIDRYEILATLGKGAMGVVYRARDPQLDRVVALKTLRRDLGLPPEQYADLKKRFYQEATAAGRLNHPNLVAIHDVVEVDDVPYMVMEYVEGQTLAALIAATGPLPPARAVALVRQVCEALEYAHAHGVVHRDIKPGNILVDAAGIAKLSDFGIARVSGSDVTRTGVLLGTPAYMSPEQLDGQAVDARSDVYSLGVALYEALTGVNPFVTDNLVAVIARIVTVTPDRASTRNPAVPAALDDVLARALGKRPEDRYPTARAFAAALDAALAGPAATAVRPAATARSARRRMVLAAAGALLLLGVGGAGAWRWWEYQRYGSIVVTTDPAVEVFVDEEFRGRTAERPFVLAQVPVGERAVRLRLGAREWRQSGAVRRDQPFVVSYRFPPERPAPGRSPARRDAESMVHDALEKPREVLDQLKSAWDRLWRSP